MNLFKHNIFGVLILILGAVFVIGIIIIAILRLQSKRQTHKKDAIELFDVTDETIDCNVTFA